MSWRRKFRQVAKVSASCPASQHRARLRGAPDGTIQLPLHGQADRSSRPEGADPGVCPDAGDLDLCAYQRGVSLDFSRPTKPTDNAFAESFNGKVRTECLTAAWVMSLDDARSKCEAWREDYIEHRPTARSATSARSS